ncbi:MAG: MerR family transcriptional regulator [Spirochaetes bacterium]|nr:MerR family transcriptional regulator [Spirochaetota bacterium]
MNIGNNNEEKNHYTIGEAASISDVKPSVLRFWETEFKNLSPIKNKFGHRVYRKKDIEIILKIKNLLYEQGLTIKGAINALKTNFSISNPKEIREKLLEILSMLRK